VVEIPDTLALYIHWPFCLAKCPYCDFNSHVRDAIPQARCGGSWPGKPPGWGGAS
jgi:hypothetical protein